MEVRWEEVCQLMLVNVFFGFQCDPKQCDMRTSLLFRQCACFVSCKGSKSRDGGAEYSDRYPGSRVTSCHVRITRGWRMKHHPAAGSCAYVPRCDSAMRVNRKPAQEILVTPHPPGNGRRELREVILKTSPSSEVLSDMTILSLDCTLNSLCPDYGLSNAIKCPKRIPFFPRGSGWTSPHSCRTRGSKI